MFETKLEEIIRLKELCIDIDTKVGNSDKGHCFCNAILRM